MPGGSLHAWAPANSEPALHRLSSVRRAASPRAERSGRQGCAPRSDGQGSCGPACGNTVVTKTGQESTLAQPVSRLGAVGAALRAAQAGSRRHLRCLHIQEVWVWEGAPAHHPLEHVQCILGAVDRLSV